MNIRKGLGNNIRHLRIEKNITQEELGFMTGLHRTYISEVERGLRNISVDNIQIIAQSLNVKVSELFKGEEKW